MVTKERHIQFVDAAKGIGIICIVMGHTVPHLVLARLLFAFHVPLFFILSGYTYRMKNDKLSFWVSKIKRLLIPYVTFSIISILIYYVMAKVVPTEGDTRILPNMLGMLYAHSKTGYMTWNRPLWFLPCMFSSFIIFDGFERLLKKWSGKPLLVFRLLLAAALWGMGIVMNCKMENIFLPFHFESAVFLSGYMEIGLVLKTLEEECRLVERIRACRKSILVIGAAVIGGIGIGLSAMNGHTDVRGHLFGQFPVVTILNALLFSGLAVILSVRAERCKLLICCGTSSMAVLLMHKFPILFFREILPITRKILADMDTLGGTLCGIFVSAIVILMCLAAERIIKIICPAMIGK